MRTFAIGDIHGANLALVQCLERCGFNRDVDTLITLGDICDGWPYVYECVEELLTIENRIDITGNHDEWFQRWLVSSAHPDHWIQGGHATAESYLRRLEAEHMIHGSFSTGYMIGLVPEDIPADHWNFFMHQHLYYKDDARNYFFVHAGFDRWGTITENKHANPMNFYWDRDLWKAALSCKGDQKLKTIDDFDTIFIGHTTCSRIDNMRPVFAGGVWNLDTGAGWEGKLTIMDIDTKEYWQSDIVKELYPHIKGR